MIHFLFVVLLSQTETSPSADLPTPAPVTNSGEAFKDPFSNPEAPSDLPAPSEAPPPADSLSPAPAPGPASTPPLAPAAPAPAPIAAPDPTPTPGPITSPQEPQFEEVPSPLSLPPSAPAQPLPAAPKSNFSFPELDEFKGPVSQEVAQAERNYIGTPVGAWNFGFGLGMGANMNKRHEQMHFEGNGGYRWNKNIEWGGILSFRLIKDKLIGLIFTGKGLWRVTSAPTMRIDMGIGGGLGWTLRALNNTFTEGRMTARTQGEAIFYIYPTIALTSAVAVETFLFNLTTDGDSNNLMKAGGPPTQLILTAGMRWEY